MKTQFVDDENRRLVSQMYPACQGLLPADTDACEDEYNVYTCTRMQGHHGPHVAHNGRDEAVAIWGGWASAIT